MMRSPGAAIGWELLLKHRWGLTAIAGYLIVLAVIDPFGARTPDEVDSDLLAFSLIVPLSIAFMYLIAVLCFGLSGDLSARDSIYPARMFTLPVPTAALSGWPMLYGTVVAMLLWLVPRFLVTWPPEVPKFWPAAFAAFIIAWTQALMWMPYGLPGLRVMAAVLLLITADTIVIVALEFEATDAMMIAGLLPAVPLAYLVGYAALTLARRGGVTDWRDTTTKTKKGPGHEIQSVRKVGIHDLVPAQLWRRRPRPRPFASAGRAHLWFEWRRHGRSLPVLVAIVLPFELALLFQQAALTGRALVLYTLLVVMLTPRVMASFVAANFRAAEAAADPHAMAPFLATRPLTSAALIAAKLRMAARSTLAAWTLILLATPIAIKWSGTDALLGEVFDELVAIIGRPRTIAVVVLAVLGFIASTWKQLVQGLSIQLTGREWLVRVNTFVTLILTCAVLPVISWMRRKPGDFEALFDALPEILAVAVTLKMLLASWIAVRLHAERLLSDRALVIAAAAWLAAVLAVYGAFAWLTDSPQIPKYFLLLLAILFVPLARVSAAPLALAWNRHR